jgi:hypothetical protein
MGIDVLGVIKAVAPWIGTALGGPLGGMAITAACDVFGLSEKTEDTLKAAIGGATPEQMIALKTADQDFALKMQELGFTNMEKMEALVLADKDSARKREMVVKDHTPRNLAYTAIGGFIGISLMQLVALMFFPDKATAIPSQGWLLIGNISGYLEGIAAWCWARRGLFGIRW